MAIQIVTDPLVPSHMLAAWAIQRMPHEDINSVAELGPYRAFGVLKDGKACAVVIYNWFREMQYGNDVRVIIASDDPSWCLPGVLRELFRYPFEVAGCERITAVIRDGNERSLKLCLGLGFRREGVMRKAHNGKTNAILLGMLKHECKWLNRGRPAERVQFNGKEKPLSPDAARSAEDDLKPGEGRSGRATGKRADQQRKPVRPQRERDIRV